MALGSAAGLRHLRGFRAGTDRFAAAGGGTPFPGRLSSHPDSAAELPQFFDRPRLGIDQSAADRALHAGSPLAARTASLQSAALASLTPEPPVDPDRPPDARDGMFKLIFTSAYLDSSGSGRSWVTELDLRTVLALPIPSPQAPC